MGTFPIHPSQDDVQQWRSGRANRRRAASKRTGIPEDLLPMWLGGNPSTVKDSPVYPFAGVWVVDGRRVAGQSRWDGLRDVEALERHVEQHGYPWQPGYTGNDYDYD